MFTIHYSCLPWEKGVVFLTNVSTLHQIKKGYLNGVVFLEKNFKIWKIYDKIVNNGGQRTNGSEKLTGA